MCTPTTNLKLLCSSLIHIQMVLIFNIFLLYGINEVFGWKTNLNDCHVEIPTDESRNETAVNYYLNLISTEIEKSENYQMPKNNSYFLEGAANSETEFTDFGEFDFIIVGAGTAGSTLAYGLTEINHWNVLVIEAGGNETDFSDIPGLCAYLYTSRMNWGYFTTPQENSCGASNDSTCSYHRGLVVGGSSTINGMQYVRGNKNDYDRWALQGNPGWSYAEVLPYFKKLERSRVNGDPGYHGTDGLLSVEYGEPASPLLYKFLEANEAVGIKVLDYNGANQLGANRAQTTTLNGRRESGGNVFMSRAECRNNFHISKNSLVTKILTDNSKRAYGVEFIRFGKNYTATARKEVILSAGALNSPQLLLLSGIGPKEELVPLEIEVVQDLPGVGRNLQDQPIMPLSFTTNWTTTFSPSTEDLIRLYLKGVGPYATGFVDAAHSFIRLESSKLAPGVPNIQLIYYTSPSIINDTLSLHSLSVFLILLHGKSRGSLTLTSKNALNFPAIDPNYLHEEEDRQVFYEGIEATMKLFETEPFRQINATFAPTSLPECDQYEFRSRNYWICYMKYASGPVLHATSGTSMGIGPDSVVDSRLRVRGIKNLRVVDVGVMPFTPSGNTAAAAFMIGAKASDIIKLDNFFHI